MASKKKAAQQAPEIHQWTHDGNDVLIVKCVGPNGETHGGFLWPLTVGAEVSAPDWDPVAECGNGLHGWPWGLSIGDGKEPDWTATWLVFAAKAADVVDLGGKVKAKCGRVVYVGDWQGATNFVLGGQIAWVVARADGVEERSAEDSGAASATGGRGAASATGERGAASATGESGAASATGGSGAASATGGRGAASATGWSGAASATGESSIAAVTGLDGRARGGVFGAIALAFWNASAERQEMRCARIGTGDGSDGLLKANVWYALDANGYFVEVEA